MRIIGAENRWGHDPRPVWLWIGTSIGAGGEGRDDPWEYDVEIEGDWARAQVLRRLVPGMPWLFINGEPLDPGMVREKMGISPDTLQAKIRDHGAVGYTNPRTGDIFEFEIRLENLEEAARFVQANREREKERRKEEAREIKKALMAEMRKDPEAEARRVAAMRAYWAKRTPADSTGPRNPDPNRGLRNEVEKARKLMVFTPRPSIPGAIQKLFFNGKETRANVIIKALGFNLTAVLSHLLREGDFRTPGGDLVEIRLTPREEFFKQRTAAAVDGIRDSLPYKIEPWEKGRELRKNDTFLFNGEPMSPAEIARKIGVHKQTLPRISRKGRIVARDGSYIVDRAPAIYPINIPKIRNYVSYSTVRWGYRGKEYDLMKSKDREKIQRFYEEIIAMEDLTLHPALKKIIEKTS